MMKVIGNSEIEAIQKQISEAEGQIWYANIYIKALIDLSIDDLSQESLLGIVDLQNPPPHAILVF